MTRYSAYTGLASSPVPSKGLNGTPIFNVEDLPIGRVRVAGERASRLLTVSLRVERVTGREAQSVTHAPLSEYVDFAMSTTAWERPSAYRDHYAGGAGTGGKGRGMFAQVTTYEEGFSPERAARLAEIANRWHLNGVKAGCVHMPVLSGDYDTYRDTLCTETGYKFGAAWLVEELPENFIPELDALFAGLDQGRIWREGETPEEVTARRGHTFA